MHFGKFFVWFFNLLPKPAATINAFVFDWSVFFINISISSSLKLLFFKDLIKEIILGLLSIYSERSGGTDSIDSPAKLYNNSRSAFNKDANLLINSTLGALRLFFSRSFK